MLIVKYVPLKEHSGLARRSKVFHAGGCLGCVLVGCTVESFGFQGQRIYRRLVIGPFGKSRI